MPRIRGSVLPEKWRKKSLFSKPGKHNITPSVANGVNHRSGLASAVRTFPAFHAVDHWHDRRGLGNIWYRYQSSTNKGIILQLTNILVTAYMLGGNVYTLTSRWDVIYTETGGKKTYFTPAPWSFLMWPFIYTLMLSDCLYQFYYRGSSVLVDEVGWQLLLLHTMSALYNRCRNGQRYKYAFVWIVITYIMVNKIYRKLRSSLSIREQPLCPLSISLYHGWVLGLVFLAAFEVFGVDAAITPAHSGTKVSMFLSFMLIQLCEWVYASPATKGDLFACVAISWFLFAITVEQSPMRSAFAHWSAHGFATFSLCWITKCMIGLELRDNVS